MSTIFPAFNAKTYFLFQAKIHSIHINTQYCKFKTKRKKEKKKTFTKYRLQKTTSPFTNFFTFSFSPDIVDI